MKPLPIESPLSTRATSGPTADLALAHARFARAALLIYLAAAAIAVGLFVVSPITDQAHDQAQVRERLLLETDLGAHSLASHLRRLEGELRRLGTRSEVNLFDQNLAPEKSLLDLAHEKSMFFNVGVAIIHPTGEVAYAVPKNFLGHGVSFASEPWFDVVRHRRIGRIVPVQPDRPDSLLYVVSPIIRGGAFAGALLGGIDVARDGPLSEGKGSHGVLTVLATREGIVVYPPKPPKFSFEPAWKAIFGRTPIAPFSENTTLEGHPMLLAASPVSDTSLFLLSLGQRDQLYGAARTRFATRLAAGLALAIVPLVLLVLLLQRSIKVFRRSEEAAVREERLRLLGEAANSIAHEVKNALNGLTMGLDLVVRPSAEGRREQLLAELRREIGRLSEFTTELMTFSKGIEPRFVNLDLSSFLDNVTSLVRDAAAEIGTDLALKIPSEPVRVHADPTLLRVVISNLAGNALDAVSGRNGDARVEVRVDLPQPVAPNTKGLGFVELRVIDNGPGVSASMKSRLFEPFQTGKPNGVGIGLALSRKIARAHGGDLVLEPTRPGASFLLTLPLEDA